MILGMVPKSHDEGLLAFGDGLCAFSAKDWFYGHGGCSICSRYFYQNKGKSQWGKLTFPRLLFEMNSYSISLSRAHSKVVLHVHGMDEAGVQFPVGPPETDEIYNTKH